MLTGDLSTMALADVMQWVDAHRSDAVVVVDRGEGIKTWLAARNRSIVATAAPLARGVLATDGTPELPGPGLRALAEETLLDLFLINEGRFELRENGPIPVPHVAVDLHIPFLVMEGMRLVDEWARLDSTYKDDAARLHLTEARIENPTPIQQAILELAASTPTLAHMRLVLGLSRQALLRRVDELRQIGVVSVEGSSGAPDPESALLEQASLLLREKQFDEAAHVFRSLLASDPTDPRARRLLHDTEQAHVEELYRALLPTHVVMMLPDALASQRLTMSEQAVVACLEGRPRAVAVVVLVSPLRELETLKALRRLVERGLVELEAAD